jgi:hypothetical protein
MKVTLLPIKLDYGARFPNQLAPASLLQPTAHDLKIIIITIIIILNDVIVITIILYDVIVIIIILYDVIMLCNS